MRSGAEPRGHVDAASQGGAIGWLVRGREAQQQRGFVGQRNKSIRRCLDGDLRIGGKPFGVGEPAADLILVLHQLRWHEQRGGAVVAEVLLLAIRRVPFHRRSLEPITPFLLEAREHRMDQLVRLGEVLALGDVLVVDVHHELSAVLGVDPASELVAAGAAADPVDGSDQVGAYGQGVLLGTCPQLVGPPLDDLFGRCAVVLGDEP